MSLHARVAVKGWRDWINFLFYGFPSPSRYRTPGNACSRKGTFRPGRGFVFLSGLRLASQKFRNFVRISDLAYFLSKISSDRQESSSEFLLYNLSAACNCFLPFFRVRELKNILVAGRIPRNRGVPVLVNGRPPKFPNCDGYGFPSRISI
jgi:hypothetical protein